MVDGDKKILTGKLENQSSIIAFEAGKQMYLESINNGRDYCKHMITISSSSIPIYVALLGNDISLKENFILAIPTIFFLMAMIFYCWGFFPKKQKINPDNQEKIEEFRSGLIDHRYKWGYCGFIVFLIGTVSGLFVVLKGY